MKKVINLALITLSSFLISGCNVFEGSSTNLDKTVHYENNITVTKNVEVSSNSSNVTIDFSSNLDYLKKLQTLDSNFFELEGNKIKLNITPKYSDPKDANGDNIYEVELYAVDKMQNDFILKIKLEVTKDSNSSGSDNNNSNSGGGSADNNNSGGSDNNTTAGGDNNNSGGIDNNATTGGDNNSSGGSDNNGTGSDNNNSGGGDNNSSTDANNNNIPDDIEAMLNASSAGVKDDEFFNKQWYIKAEGTATNPSEVASVEGNDLNLDNVYKSYMGYNKGRPIIIQIVDSGVDIKHEDLKENIDLSRSLNNDKQGDPTPGGFYRPHGTMLSGIAAARAFNGKGIRGVAPFAKIAGSNWLVNQSIEGLDAAWLSGDGANEIAVTNNSWGRYYTSATLYEDIMEEGSKTLRDGKGRIYIFASGNARKSNADANIQYVINNQYALVVSALNYENRVASYSTAGANVWITAYGGADDFKKGPTIATTYISGEASETWSSDTNKNYTYAMAGSSAAAPMVTGAVALILEACPNLRWRDVKYIVAKSAKKVDMQNSSWVTNSQGLSSSRDYGFGLIDTQKAIDICKNGYSNLGAQYKITSTRTFSDLRLTQEKELSINMDTDKKIEWVEATVDLNTTNASDYDIYLTSPSGTKVQLIQHGTLVDANHIPDANWMSGGFRFGASAFLDESSLGEWKIKIVDTKTNSATLKSIELKIYGH